MSAGARTLTFLLTDIEGSTARWERAPQEMSMLLVQHDHLLRRAVERSGGTRVKSTGDGILAVFDVPSAAVWAAVHAQVALIEEGLGGDDSLRVRMGVHTGEGEPRDGDYYGAAVNLAARFVQRCPRRPGAGLRRHGRDARSRSRGVAHRCRGRPPARHP